MSDVNGHSMEPWDLNTRLPPRKRLLAGLRTASVTCDLEPNPFPLVSGDLGARLRDLVSSVSSSPEGIVEAARSAAAEAADAAAAARAAAMEKAVIAAKARAAARNALEFLDSISRRGASRNGLRVKAKSKKKHVQVKLLYKPNGHVEKKENKEAVTPPRGKETDEELARKLHRAINSSPRISNNRPKRPRTSSNGKNGSSGGDVMCNGSSAYTSVEVGELTNGCSMDKSSERAVLCSKPDTLEDDEESPKYTGKRRTICNDGIGIGNFAGVRKAKVKRKKLLLNQYSSREGEEPKETQHAVDCVAYDESKANGVEKRVSLTGTKPSNDDLVPLKITSVWKFKKFKAPPCSSNSKILHAVCSSSSATGTSAAVKAD